MTTMPEAVFGRLTPAGFVPVDRRRLALLLSGEKASFSARRAKPTSLRAVALARLELPLLRLFASLPLPRSASDYVLHTGAFTLHAGFPYLDESRRRSYHQIFEIGEDEERRRAFRGWMEEQECRAGQAFLTDLSRETIEPQPSDRLVLIGLSGGAPLPEALDDPDRVKATVVVILLEVGPLHSPAIVPQREYVAAVARFEKLAGIASLFIVPSEHVRNVVSNALDRIWSRQVAVKVVEPFFPLSPHGEEREPEGLQDKLQAPGKFCLAIASFKQRKNIYWLASAWRKAVAATTLDLPHLVIAASTCIDPYRADLVTKDPRLAPLITLLDKPSDPELRWLLRRAAFLVHPPSQGGLGTALTEAIVFGKQAICERHSAYEPFRFAAGVQQVDFDADAWVSAIVNLIANSNGGEQMALQTYAARKLSFGRDLREAITLAGA